MQLFTALQMMAVQMLRKTAQCAASNAYHWSVIIVGVVRLALTYYGILAIVPIVHLLATGGWPSVPLAKLQVAVVDPQRQLQHQLPGIASKAYTSRSSDASIRVLQGR